MDQSLFSLRWNEYHQHISNGLNEQLMQNAFTDVTLAADGELLNAHKNVLAACSPYFYKMFSEMPENKQGFIFLKGVSSSTLRNLMQFMYSGEVNVSNETLSEFISLAKELQIKGLMESDAQPQTKSTLPSKKDTPKSSEPDSALKKSPKPFKRPQKPILPRSSKSFANLPSAGASIRKVKVSTHQSKNENQAGPSHQTESQSSKRMLPNPVALKSMKRQKLSDSDEDTETEIDAIDQNDDNELVDLMVQTKKKLEEANSTESDDSELEDETVKGEVKVENGNSFENNDNAGTSTKAEASDAVIMCLMSNKKNLNPVVDDFIYFYHSQRQRYLCRRYNNVKNRCLTKLNINGDTVEVNGEHNHPSEAGKFDESKLRPYHPSLLKKSSA